jgi:hypothetical protein
MAAALPTGCEGFMRGNSKNLPGSAEMVALDHGYSLLYSTLADESKVDQVLMIKNPDPQVDELIKAIGQFSRDAKDRLQAFAQEDPTLSFNNQGLPKVEIVTRTAISSATSKQIVFSGGKEFEFRILLTQHEALNYITHLADSLSKQETVQARKSYLAQLAEESNALHERVVAQLQAPYVGQPN